MTTVGFTGTRRGMTLQQRSTVLRLLVQIKPALGVHGDCLGADKDFDDICMALKIPCRIRPCTIENMRAWCHSDDITAPKPPMQRNRDIVADCSTLIACPPNTTPIKSHSGTWATVKFGLRAGVGVILVYPDGQTKMHPPRKEP